jgi:flagellar basal body-associated protein FliL
MDLWMYLVIIAMFVLAAVGTVWITLWTIQRGERAKAEREQATGEGGNREQGTGNSR